MKEIQALLEATREEWKSWSYADPESPDGLQRQLMGMNICDVLETIIEKAQQRLTNRE